MLEIWNATYCARGGPIGWIRRQNMETKNEYTLYEGWVR